MRIGHATASLLAGVALGCALGSGGPRPAWELPPPPAPEVAVVPAGSLQRVQLDNGLRVLVLEDPRLPRVVLGVTFCRGEASVAPDRAGLASYTAELMKRGAGPRPALEFANYVDAIGATLSVYADWDSMTVQVVGLSRDLDRLFEILADVVLAPRFEPEEGERARSERLAALERAADDPETLLGWYTAAAVYGDHRFGTPLEGRKETVAGFDAELARTLHGQVARPNNAILYASGDISAAALRQRAQQLFGTWPAGPVLPLGQAPPDPAPASRRIVVVDRPELAQAQIAVAHEGISRTAEDRIAVALMNTVLGGGGFSSRLFKTLRAEEGLTYGVSTGYSLRRQPGPFIASTSTRVSETRRALDLLLAELARMRSEPPGDKELGWARTLMTGRFSMGLETSAAVMDALVDLDVYGLPEDSLDTYRSRVRAVSAEEVARAAREHLHPDRAAIVVVGPADALREQLAGLGPLEVRTP
jgi:zinc protease